nr:Hsp70 family protein [Nocardioides zeae]
MPSAVLLADGRLVVGSEALAGRRSAPEHHLASPKLLLGQDSVLLGDEEVEVVALVARTLRHVLDVARREAAHAGQRAEEPERVVLTHPQTWALPRRRALEEAWRRTGSTAPVTLVAEPIAAVSWFADAERLPDGADVAVLDFGGGTCDVAVLHHRSGAAAPLEITAHAGLDDLGGSTIDHVFALWVRAQVRAQGHLDLDEALDRPEHLADLHALYDAAREAKHRLADWEYADVPVSAGATTTSVTVTIAEFHQVVAHELERARALLGRSLEAAGVRAASLHGLYLTGGSSRLRWVHQMAADLLGGRPAHLAEPHLAVALGAHTATRLRVVERADAESSRFITLRGLQAVPDRSRSVPLPPPDPSTRRAGAPPPARPRPVGPAQAAPPPAYTTPAPGAHASPSPAGGRTAGAVLLAGHPRLRAAADGAPELRHLLEEPPVLVALLAVPALLDQVARHPALLLVPTPDGRPRALGAPTDVDSALLPVRTFLGAEPAWARALEDPAWRADFVARQGGGPEWAHRLVTAWPRLSPTEQAEVRADAAWQPPPAAPVPWITRTTGRVTVAVPPPPATRPAGAAAAAAPPSAGGSSAQADVLDVLAARGCFTAPQSFRQRLDAARDPRLPIRRARVTLQARNGRHVDLDPYLFPGGRHRSGGGAPDRDLPPYLLLLPVAERSEGTGDPVLVLTSDLVVAVGPRPGGPTAAVDPRPGIVVDLAVEVGPADARLGRRLDLATRDVGLGVDLARALGRPWRG